MSGLCLFSFCACKNVFFFLIKDYFSSVIFYFCMCPGKQDKITFCSVINICSCFPAKKSQHLENMNLLKTWGLVYTELRLLVTIFNLDYVFLLFKTSMDLLDSCVCQRRWKFRFLVWVKDVYMFFRTKKAIFPHNRVFKCAQGCNVHLI